MQYRKRMITRFIALLLVTILVLPMIMNNVIYAKELASVSTLTNGTVKTSTNQKKYVGDGYEIEFCVDSQWKGAFNGNITIKNTSNSVIDNWALEFEFQHEITNIWNGKIKSHEDGVYTITNATWNQDIPVNGTVNFGFSAKADGDIKEPQNYKIQNKEESVTDDHYKISYKVYSDWGAAFNGEINITNTSNEIIEDWTLEFDFVRNIKRFWTAEIISHDGIHYNIKNAGYNANISPGETIKLGFEGDSGNINDEPTNFELSKIGQETGTTKDKDGDKLPDDFEKELGTDTKNKDTDADGLDDGYEYLTLDTDPCKKDSNGNGINDGDENFDEDILTNKEEYKLGLDPYYEDSDTDGLTDSDESITYNTNPLVFDTDEDGIGDGDEIKLKLNPKTKYTNNGVLDSEYTTEQEASEEILESYNSDNCIQASIKIKAAGLIDTSLEVSESCNKQILADNDSIVGKILSLGYEDLKFEKAELSFTIDKTVVNETDLNYPNETGLQGVKRFQIFHYDEENAILYPIETKYDVEHNTLTAETTVLGDYCVIDMDQWLYSLGVDLDNGISTSTINNKNIDNTITNNEKYMYATKVSEEDINTEKDILPDNYNEIIIDKIDQVSRNITTNANTLKKQIDLVFIIDTSKSMEEQISQCKKYMKTLVQNLYNEGITARVAVVSFSDYQMDNKIYKLSSGSIWGKNPTEASKLISKVDITAGEYENHVDALETAMDLSYRSNTTKFAVMLTDEPLNQDDNNSKIGASGIAKKLKNEGFITSIVCSNKEIDSFKSIYENTNGIQISISDNFNLYLEIFIKTVMRDNNIFLTVIPSNLTTISLKSTPKKSDKKTDSDNDSLVDSDEIDWTLIKEKSDNLQLPTLQEYLKSYNFKNIETFARLSIEKQKIINSIVVLPIKSNPEKADGDRDGYKDPKDPRPLINDVIKVALRYSKFVPIMEDKKEYYGGDQDWFKSDVARAGACGTVASANIMAYLANTNKKLSDLYKYNDYTKNNYISHMNNVYKYLYPYKLPFTSVPLGIWPLSKFKNGTIKYAKSCNVDLKPVHTEGNFNKTISQNFIKKGLKKNAPVAMLIGLNSKFKNIKVEQPNGHSWNEDIIQLHWVTITEISIDKISNKTQLKVSTWGGYSYLDLDTYLKGVNLKPSLIYFNN